MRELKFRVWSEEDKQYRTDCKLRYLFTSPTGLPSTVYNDEGDRFDIEQYTGLKDKNGKEIYEGDIVKMVSRYYKVEWDNFYNLIPDVEVIGNIHENADLLEEE